jgi:hypothetical protein
LLPYPMSKCTDAGLPLLQRRPLNINYSAEAKEGNTCSTRLATKILLSLSGRAFVHPCVLRIRQTVGDAQLPNKVQATPTQIQPTFIMYSNATSTVKACQNREYLQHEAVIRTRNLQKMPSNPKLNKIHYNRYRPVEMQFRKPTRAQAKLGIMGHNSSGGNTRIGTFPHIDGLHKIKFHDSLP